MKPKENKKDIIEGKEKNIKEKNKRIKKEKLIDKDNVVKKSLEFSLLEVIIIILVTTALVSVASGVIIFRNYDKLYILNKPTSVKSTNEIIDNYNQILNNYVDKVDKNELIDAAIKGMYDYLNDEYSIYIDKNLNKSLQEQLTGKYRGIGIEITMNDKNEIIINRVFNDSPAKEAGLQKGDILIELDGINLKDKDSAYVSNIIKESNKESFKLVYNRDGKNKEIIITRKNVIIDSVESEKYGNVGYIKLDTFSSSTYDQLKKVLDNFDSEIKSVVIDLRDNTGGYLNIAHDISDLFLKKDQIIYKIKDNEGKVVEYKSIKDAYKEFDKIVVLINENTASASEILTLTLKENLNATIVGVKSYGKGTVQETKQLSSGAMVKYTTSYWLSPKGNSINKIGIKPDIEEKNKDKQLEKALNVIK